MYVRSERKQNDPCAQKSNNYPKSPAYSVDFNICKRVPLRKCWMSEITRK